MLLLFSVESAAILLAVGMILGRFIPVTERIIPIMDIFSLGMGRMFRQKVLHGIAMFLSGWLMAFFINLYFSYYDLHGLETIIGTAVFLLFTLKMALLQDNSIRKTSKI
ncbi:hypothetical protein KO561_02655 [Radiobacillus kanasensis]|uniref:hypothetical protein n=1 Tax=Radiobacillus kanasensis TaxID=2844358 RepID=UPI001E48DB3E|nr:hypothetical protein [Radiobacillus kanasensis]UFT99881.1 hypothetical protein KO561_02655 [Radiobacillus kanasensis]